MAADSDSDDSHVAFASIDFTGVDFDSTSEEQSSAELNDLLLFDQSFLFGHTKANRDAWTVDLRLRELGEHLASGTYVDALKGEVANEFFSVGEDQGGTVLQRIRERVFRWGVSLVKCVEMELLGVAAINLFLQLNYTGPTLDRDIDPSVKYRDPLEGINPHACFSTHLIDDTKKETPQVTLSKGTKYHNSVLSELAVEGQWPSQVCEVPYLLLIARSIFLTLADPANTSSWALSDEATLSAPNQLLRFSSQLTGARLWSARAAVTHQRLLQGRTPSVTLWKEVDASFEQSSKDFKSAHRNSTLPAEEQVVARRNEACVMLERGLAEHHFDRPQKGKQYFNRAVELSGLSFEVTGAEGKRTKFQQKTTAQMVVRATSTETKKDTDKASNKDVNNIVKKQEIGYSEDGVLLEKINFVDEKENEVTNLNELDQSIVLSLCLDVKNSNPADGLTAEQMGAFLARVLNHHDNWMIYSTALLERAWLEFEGVHGRERAILQLQALTDQHTNRLTVTQSTQESIEESAPAQDRLRYLHCIVYPPRWSMLEDLADRLARMGIVTSAAELYTDIELWDDAVDCYRRAGKEDKAEQIVRERLAVAETPRMWAALGDLTGDPSHYEKAVELSKGRYSDAFVALGKYYFDKGDLKEASKFYRKSLKIRPLSPAVWFRVGTISMQLGDWEEALGAFSEVVQQEPEEAEAWANVAAVHMHNKQPAEAYPALVESLKYNRNNWRVWVSKLYTCLDLKKYDESIQACTMLMDFQATRGVSEGVPDLEEKCVRAIVGGVLETYQQTLHDSSTEFAQDSARRSVTRAYELLERLSSKSSPKPWVFETLAFLNDCVGRDEKVYENLMKEYRALQAVPDWEKDDFQINKVCQVALTICQIQRREGSKESLSKSRFLLQGIIRKVRANRLDESKIPQEVTKLETVMEEVLEQLKSLNDSK